MISWAYLSLIALMVVFKIYLRFEYVHQLAPERITSFDKAMTYQMYYYIIIQFGVSMLLSIQYLQRIQMLKHCGKCTETNSKAKEVAQETAQKI